MPIGWDHYQHNLIEIHEQGILQLAVAAPGNVPCEIVQQHAPFGKRIVRWVVAAKAKDATGLPEVPAANQFTADAVLERREVASCSPIPFAKGIFLYIFWGEYTYAMLNARPIDGDFPIGNLPPSIANLGDAASVFPAAKFQRFLDTGKFAAVPKARG